MRRYLVFFAVLSTAVSAGAQTFGLEHYSKLARVAEPQITADGQSVVAVISWPNYEANVHDSDLLRIDLRTKQSRTITSRKTVSHPRWSPNGAQLAFLARVGDKSQIFLMESDGGEARQVTTAPNGVQAFSWKPDGTAFAYLTADSAPKREKFDDAFEVDNNDYLMHASTEPTHLWTIAVSGGDARRWTSGKKSAAGPVSWSPNGDRIAMLLHAGAGTRAFDLQSILIVSMKDGKAETLAGSAERHCGRPVFSADGNTILASCPIDGKVKNQNELAVMPLGSGDWVPAAFDRSISQGFWLNPFTLFASTSDGTLGTLWTIPFSGVAQKWNLGKISATEVSLSKNGKAVFVGTEPQRPPELYVSSGPGATPERLTDLHASIAALRLGKTESVFWKSDDGLPLSAVITFPPDFDASKKYPVLLYIHGGPWGSSKETFSARPQLFASKGWIIYEPNYRGSDNAGNALYSAVYRDHGAGPGRDVMSGLEALKKRPYVDASRIGVSGWSYGGYMTTWLIGHYSGWKAAMAGAAVIDLVDDYNLNDFRLFIRAYGDTLTQPKDLELMKEQSPGTYVDQMKTPLLLISDTGDVRVPVTQSYKLLNALKERGQDVRMVLYPVPGHFPADPFRARDVDKRWAEWFEQRLK